MPDPIEHLLAAIAARDPAGVIGWRSGAAVSNADFLARVTAWHALLRAQAGRHFALYHDDSIEFGAALLGAWHAGKTIWLGADTLPATCAALSAEVDGFLGHYPTPMAPLQPSQPSQPGQLPGASVVASPPWAWPALDPAMPALVVFTSGSTGAPQAIPKRLAQIASEVATLEVLFGAMAGADAAVLATVSHQHIYGLLFKVLWPLAGARPLHAFSIGFHEALAPALAAGPCVLVASPAHLKRLPAHLDWAGGSQMLGAVFSSGGPLPSDAALEAAALLGRAPVEVYGSSETGGVAWRQRRRQDDDRWQPFPTVDWRLGAEGNLEVRSPHLADEDWLALADRAAPDDEDGFVLLGRSDRIVKIEEKRISLSAMEAVLLASGLALEARVIVCAAAPGESRQRLAAFVVPTPAGNALLDTAGKQALNGRLREALAPTVEAVALPRRWRYLARMPLNAQGKLTQAALQALLDGDAGEPAAALLDAPRLPRMRELSCAAERVLLEVTAPADLLYFDGHFDVAPILPGVVQLEWALHYGRHYFDLPPHFEGVNALKFQQVVTPEQPVQLELAYDAAKGSLAFRYLSGGAQHASGRIMLAGAVAQAGEGSNA